MGSSDGRVTIGLSGPFSLVLPDGRDVRLKSRKAQACLALLATATGMRRSRAWLADKLWSDRGPEQASGSLRQTLVELRRALADFDTVLDADRQMVWLDPARVRVERGGPAEFLEGIDVRDPEWEEWLRGERAADFAARMPHSPRHDRNEIRQARPEPRLMVGSVIPPAPVSAAIIVDDRGDPAQSFVGGVVAERLAKLLVETLGLRVQMDDGPRATMRLHIVPRRGPHAVAVTVSLRDPEGVVVWSGTRMVPVDSRSGIDRPDVLALVFEAQDALAAHLVVRQSDQPDPVDHAHVVQRAANDLFSFEASRMHAAEKSLEALAAEAPTPVVLGWLMMAYRTLILERLEAATPERLERIEATAARAMELGPTHAFSLAAASAMFVRFLGRESDGVDLARRAVRINPANPFAVDALGSAQYLCGQFEDGYGMARLAGALAANTRFSPYFDMGMGVAATLTGRHDEAVRYARSATAVSPHFRAGWRYRIAHAAHRGDEGEVRHCVRRLALIERDFTPERMVTDPGYPAAAIRRSDLDLTLLRAAD